MTDQPLSPASQAVLAAYHKEAIDYIESWGSFSHKRGMAAALRAAANDWRIDTEFIAGVEYIRTSTLERIAAELEGQP
jgi:hypothetical protein